MDNEGVASRRIGIKGRIATSALRPPRNDKALKNAVIAKGVYALWRSQGSANKYDLP